MRTLNSLTSTAGFLSLEIDRGNSLDGDSLSGALLHLEDLWPTTNCTLKNTILVGLIVGLIPALVLADKRTYIYLYIYVADNER